MSGTETPESVADDWYEAFDPTKGLEQGDVLVDFPLTWLDFDGSSSVLRRAEARSTVLILTQTCDIPKPAQSSIMLVQAFLYEEIAEKTQHLRSSKAREALREGVAVGEMLLPPCPGVFDDYMIIAFRNTFVLPKLYVQSNVSPEARRLRSPYKEHVAQGYARFLMRVGLPKTLHGFK